MSGRSAKGWRSGALGRILRVHSPSAHILGLCWCQKRPPRAEQAEVDR